MLPNGVRGNAPFKLGGRESGEGEKPMEGKAEIYCCGMTVPWHLDPHLLFFPPNVSHTVGSQLK